MAKVIAMFNNKGGVSKTTTTFNLGWVLSERGSRVIMVDADPQCNLTGMTLSFSDTTSLNQFYERNPGRNIKEAISPAFNSEPRPITAVECFPVEGRDGLFLVPGHIGLAEEEVSLGIAHQLSETLQPLKNLPGSLRYLFDKTAEKYDADYVIVDLSPGLGAINQNIVTTADYFIVPTTPDIFSLMALDSLSRVIPKWIRWGRRATELDILKQAEYPFPEINIKFLGVITQNFRLRDGKATSSFQSYIDKIDDSVNSTLFPALEGAGATLPNDAYVESGNSNYKLANISDFNGLIATSQKVQKPVYTLTQEDTQSTGVVWERQEESIDRFRKLFEKIADSVQILTNWN
ncbi:AAA family ATPase [Rothia kristinae]|uniref:ParA family protein n=1 Tax=Rothia kristinae TaxID=37923 RepID=UPI001CD64436|nr:AAA family ATPase [Rothia kristinae]MCA1168894.1 AAA family ATPase [Rothia kristinae]